MVAHPKEQPVLQWIKKIDLDRIHKFFSTETFSKPQISTFNSEFTHLKASVPEQAFLECLLLAPRQYSLMDLYYLMEQLTSLRPDVLQFILENTDNIKTFHKRIKSSSFHLNRGNLIGRNVVQETWATILLSNGNSRILKGLKKQSKKIHSGYGETS